MILVWITVKNVGGVSKGIGGSIDMYKVVRWNESIDLTDFYAKAEQKGFLNNSNRHMLIDCFNNEREYYLNLLYENDTIIGCQVVHSFDDVAGPGAYRSGRTCTVGGSRRLLGRATITKMQNYVDQFLHPASFKLIESLGGTHYSTSNILKVGSQEKVNRTYFKELERQGIVTYVKDIEYRNTPQTLWRFNNERFWKLKSIYPSWS